MSEKPERPTIVRRGYVSERGPFELNVNPKLNPPNDSAPVDEDAITARFEYEALAEKYGEEAARKKILEMVEAYRSGASTTMLFHQESENGMSLAHIWFGPNFELFRHSHPRYGDCLYYILAGEVSVGSRKLGPGSTLFIPNCQPYKFTAGPEGVEILEYRAGGGVKDAPELHIDERTLEAIDKLIAGYRENSDKWQPPEQIGDVALRSREARTTEE